MRVSLIRKVKAPSRGTKKSAGIDFFVPEDLGSNYFRPLRIFKEGSLQDAYGIKLKPLESILIPSGVRAEIPEGFMLMGSDKSGIATKKGLLVGAKIIDEDYQGEIHMHVINVSNFEVVIEPGDKLVQFILVPINYQDVEVVCDCDIHKSLSERGEGGFGSTGVK